MMDDDDWVCWSNVLYCKVVFGNGHQARAPQGTVPTRFKNDSQYGMVAGWIHCQTTVKQPISNWPATVAR